MVDGEEPPYQVCWPLHLLQVFVVSAAILGELEVQFLSTTIYMYTYTLELTMAGGFWSIH